MITKKARKSAKPVIHSVKFNVVMNVILTSSSFIFPLLTVPYASRVLSTEGLGIVSFAQSIASYFSLVSLLGIPMYGIKVCSQVRDDVKALSKVVQELLVILLVSTTAASALFIAMLMSFSRFKQDRVLFLIFLSVIWLASFGVEWFYQAIEQYGYITIRNILIKIIGLLLLFIFVKSTQDYVAYGLVVIFASYGSNIVNILRLRRFVSLVSPGKLNLKRHLKPMASYILSSVASGMYVQIDLVMLGFLSTSSVLGIYQLSVKIKNLLITVVNSVASVMLPRLSYYKATKKETSYSELLAKNLNFIVLTAVCICSICILCARPIVLLLGGNNFIQSQIPLILLTPAILFSAVNSTIAQHMISSNQEKAWSLTSLFGLISATVIMLILIPQTGATGAAIGISLCELLVLVARLYNVRTYLKELKKKLDIGRIMICGLLTLLIVLFIRQYTSNFHLVFQLLLPGIAYLILYCTSLVIVQEKFVMSVLDVVLKKVRIRHK